MVLPPGIAKPQQLITNDILNSSIYKLIKDLNQELLICDPLIHALSEVCESPETVCFKRETIREIFIFPSSNSLPPTLKKKKKRNDSPQPIAEVANSNTLRI